MKGGIWTDEDLQELTRLLKKYPNGTLSRWEVIGNQMNRPVQEVTFQAARLKDIVYRQSDSVAEAFIKETSKKVKKIDAAPTVAENLDKLWTQEQQELLEIALSRYSKMTAGDRWQKIANTVPGKTKEECLARCKFLAQKIMKEQKLKAEEAEKQKITDESERIENVNDIETANLDAETPNNGTVRLDEPLENKLSGGKPRNKRKERKKRMEFSSDEDEYNNDN